jgi:uncharacterized protein
LLRQTADAGLPDAQYDYGAMLLDGNGIAPDPPAGAHYVGLAAAAGNLAAQVEYATLLYLGRGVPRNVALSAAWYRTAAEAGNPVGQVRLAKLLAVGDGMVRDRVEAGMWRALARRQGLVDQQLDSLLQTLSADDLARAEERARFWPEHPPLNTTAAPPDTPSPGAPATTGSIPDSATSG